MLEVGTALELLRRDVERDPGGPAQRKTVDPRRDGRKRHGAAAELRGERERGAVARREQLVLAAAAAVPDGADRVDDVARRKVARGGGLRLAGLAAAEPPALLQDRWPAGAVNGAVDAAAAEQRPVGRVDDRVCGMLRDVSLHDPDAIRGARSCHLLSVDRRRER